jgi:hypothetical protein
VTLKHFPKKINFLCYMSIMLFLFHGTTILVLLVVACAKSTLSNLLCDWIKEYMYTSCTFLLQYVYSKLQALNKANSYIWRATESSSGDVDRKWWSVDLIWTQKLKTKELLWLNRKWLQLVTGFLTGKWVSDDQTTISFLRIKRTISLLDCSVHCNKIQHTECEMIR